jgi:organic hydroperoxide reductase OsmC/OhrA
MAIHTATIEWHRKGANFLDRKFSRAHDWHFDGGLTVRGSAAPGVLRPPLADPTAVDPEEALVAALSSCHMLFFLAFAAKDGFVVDSYVDRAEGLLERSAEGKTSITQIILRPDIAYEGEAPSAEKEAEMHHMAHDHCYIANSIKADVTVEAPVAA